MHGIRLFTLIFAIVSASYADESMIPTFKGSFPIGAQCVMHYKTSEVLATVIIEATNQEFTIEKVNTFQKFREVSNRTYYKANGAEKCDLDRRNYGKKRGFRL